MPSERTPLITTHQAGPQRQRYHHNVARRFCTIALSSTLIWVFFTWITTAILGRGPAHRHHGHGDWSWPGHKNRRLDDEGLRKVLTQTPSSELAEEWSRYYTSGPHLAGQNYSQAEWTRNKWESWGIDSSIVAYDVYLNRPVDHRLALLEKATGGKHDEDLSLSKPSWEVKFEASLKEDIIDDDPTTALNNAIPTFHGYSASGNVTAQFVYVNYGTYQDFEDLVKANVSLKGKIAIARYGGIFRGLKVKRAQELGMTATVIYSDPGDDGSTTDEKGEKQYPEGPARQASSVQRGSAQFLSIAPGDPTTPGYPSLPGAPRQDPHNAIPQHSFHSYLVCRCNPHSQGTEWARSQLGRVQQVLDQKPWSAVQGRQVQRGTLAAWTSSELVQRAELHYYSHLERHWCHQRHHRRRGHCGWQPPGRMDNRWRRRPKQWLCSHQRGHS